MFRTGVTGNMSCSVPGAVGNDIYSEAMSNSSFFVPGASSCNVYSATGDGICSNAMGDDLLQRHWQQLEAVAHGQRHLLQHRSRQLLL